jgi:hypothetical protein
MKNTDLKCELDLTPAAGGDITLAFQVQNPTRHSVEIHFFRPFVGFELTVKAADGPIPLIQPAYDVPVQPQTLTLAPGATTRIDTPIHLRFDPQVPPSGGDVPTRWSLAHAPVPIQVQATLQLTGAEVAPCEARFDPHPTKHRHNHA